MKTSTFIPKILSFLILLSGLVNIFSSVLSFSVERLSLLETFIPIESTYGSRTVTLLLGFLLLYTAKSIWQRKRNAWIVSMVLLTFSLFSNLLKGFDIGEVVASFIPLSLLIYYRQLFTIQSGGRQIIHRLRITLLFLLGLLLYAYIGFFAFDGQFNKDVTVSSITFDYVNSLTGVGADLLIPKTIAAQWFENSVTDLGILILITSFSIFFSPLLLGKKLTDEEKQKVHDIILRYGTFPASYLSLMEDKEYYFPPYPDCVIAYKTRNSTAMVFGNPIGPKANLKNSIQIFIQDMHQRGLAVAFCNVPQEDLNIYKSLHLKEMKIGEEAFLQTDTFTTEGSTMAEIRQSINRMKRENAFYQWYPFSEIPWHVLTDVTTLHTEWQKNKKFASLTFSLDFYPLPVESNAYILTVYSPTHTLWGAFTFFPYNNLQGMVLDTMLRSKEAPNGMVEAAFAESLQYLKGKRVNEVSLGGAPLANSEEISQESILDQATKRVFENFNQIYGFRSLFTFKKKFTPEWKPMYLVYENNSTLPNTILALLQVHIQDSLKKVFIKKIFKQY